MSEQILKQIAVIHTDFSSKFGIPRQSGLVSELMGRIVFCPEYQNPDCIMGIEEYSHLWLLWDFSLAHRETFSPTVFPPRLGGKEKRGIFATRSPFRPNSIGLSSVELKAVQYGENGAELIVAGADLLDGTPIYDIKPYLPYTDSHPKARGGFGEAHKSDGITVVFPGELLNRLPEEKREAARQLLQQDPRAAYQKKPDYIYGMEFAGFDIRFIFQNDILEVKDVIDISDGQWEEIN